MIDAFISGLINGNTYALVAVGISLIFGVADLINFAHGSVFAIGAMVGWWLASTLHWPLLATILAVIVVTGALGLVIERFCVRPLSQAPPIAPLLATVAVSFILDYSSQLIFSPETQHFPTLLPTHNLQVGDVHFGTLDLAIFAVTIASVAALWAFLKYFRLGLALRATAQDRDAAQQMGVNVGSIQGLSFAIASALAGVGGVLVGMYYGNVDPTIGFNAMLEGFAAATLGGLGSLPGAVIGGLLLGVGESFGVTFFGGSTRQLITFAVLVGVLWLRPNGLLGSAGALLREPLTGTFFGGGQFVKLNRWQLGLVGLVLIVGLPLFAGNYVLQIAAIVAIFTILALSMTLLAGTAGQISLGQAGLFAIGAYTSALLTKEHGWPFWFALPAAGLLAALIGAIVVAPSLHLRGHYVAIVTLGIGAMVTSVLLNFESLTHGPLGVTNIPPPVIFGYAIEQPRDYYLLSLAVLLLCAGLTARLQRSHLGRIWRSIREDEIAAQSFGVHLAGYKSLVFAIGAFMAGLGGSLLAHQYTYISPDIFDVTISVLALTIVVMGGMSNVLGALVGAIVLVGGPEFFRPLHDVRMLGYGILLLLLVRFRPQGILGSR
ncbi:MAG TPA: ABC transporter permease [Chloroflexota bacterium]|nr:ABC transporter permease [Chloroflexota bacterium]